MDYLVYFLFDITLGFSLFPKFDLTKIRVPGKWPYKNNGFGDSVLAFTYFFNGVLMIYNPIVSFYTSSNGFLMIFGPKKLFSFVAH